VQYRRAFFWEVFMKKSRIILGLGNGDEGKGTMTDWFCREYGATLVVRYNGGSQAGHNVVLRDGRHHTFRQIGSGAFIKGVKTLLSRHVFFDPITLCFEARQLSEEAGRYVLGCHFVDCRAPVITPFHVATNRIKEFLRGTAKHGSCGKGIGEAAYDLVNYPEEVIRAGDLEWREKTVPALKRLRERKRVELLSLGADFSDMPKHLKSSANLFLAEKIEEIAKAYAEISQEITIVSQEGSEALIRENDSVFEGAQGVLLDEWHGFHPHTTWSTTVQKNALELLRESCFDGEIETIGITRAYATRHGEGPFVTEDSAMRNAYLGEDNRKSVWQGNFREGFLDLVALRYAVECAEAYGHLDSVVVTHLDVFDRVEKVFYCDEYLFADGHKTKALSPQYEHDLAYQEGLTQSLVTARPVYAGAAMTAVDATRIIQTSLSVPVKYGSYGQTEGDKSRV